MRSTKKQILGFLGLGAVIATTAFAATLPVPGASAVTTSSVTDNIEVRVYEAGSISVSSTYGDQITTPEYSFDVAYSGIVSLKATGIRRDANGNALGGEFTIFEKSTSYDTSTTETFPANMDTYGGPGVYTITVTGLNYVGVPIERTIMVTYAIPNATIEDDPNGDLVISVTPPDDSVTKIEIDIRDENGDPVYKVVVDPNTGTVYIYDAGGKLIDTIENGYQDGKVRIPKDLINAGNYTATITFTNADGDIVGIPYTFKFGYDGEGEFVPVPDTGSFFQSLNISKEDYLITGLITFFVLGVVALGIVSRNHKSKATGRSRK